MIRVRPSFYDRFFCKASRCRHNCCIGWEIDVDPETASVYQTVGGAFGKELAEKITQGEIPHFTLCPDGRCPFRVFSVPGAGIGQFPPAIEWEGRGNENAVHIDAAVPAGELRRPAPWGTGVFSQASDSPGGAAG